MIILSNVILLFGHYSKAVYTYILNPLGNLPDIGKCEFETGGFQGKAHNLKKMFVYFVI